MIEGTEDVLHALVTDANDATLAEQAEAYDEARTGRRLSAATLCRAFRRLRLTRKTDPARQRASERDRAEVRDERSASGCGASTRARRPVFVDEAGVTTAMVRACGRAPEGRRAYGTAPAGRWRRLTVLSARAADGVAGAMTVRSRDRHGGVLCLP